LIILIYLLFIAAILSSYRLIKGPTVQDRLISINCVSIIFIILLVILSVEFNQSYYLDIAIAFLLLDFVGMIAFTKYLGGEKTK
jgi:multicomponent Na+:H+ antiporter subunit F